ncbi:ECF transporter S component [Gryllotalpicola daejeonensis]|uniref:ECF transporter S component n=1 Tax=Gryllotalpicola daejeonensis TaxID=993087 RepID=A0ABP7ZGD6_9MICO
MHATIETLTDAAPKRLTARKWRPVDIIVAAVLGIAIGVVYWLWDTPGYAWYGAADALTPGLGGVANGGWLLAGVVGALVIRKPGAAIFVELLAAVVEMGIGEQWGITTVYSGLAQGAFIELIFAIFLYRRFNVGVAMLAGAAGGFGEWALELFFFGNLAKSAAYNTIYLVSSAASGAVLAGFVGWLVVRALAATGALDRFASGRAAKARV